MTDLEKIKEINKEMTNFILEYSFDKKSKQHGRILAQLYTIELMVQETAKKIEEELT